ncbi:helix-turn-helix domain-containing protein [Streptomyces sp. NPDC048479]|uniref:helix-turn-helix domain-containing protein n=1 Tax=Streptomyces sp. NPDC048479 TaxID=3154725 RepID=UPI0034194FDD
MADPQSNAALPALPEDAPRAGVLHVRHRHTDRFTVVGNHLAQHASLSATAIGLAVHIQSLPDGASVTAKALTLRFPEGETTIRRALNELEEAGYLERRRVALGGGRIATRTLSYEKPGCAPVAPAVLVSEVPASAPRPPDPPVPEVSGPAVELLAGLRGIDPRLLLSLRDVHRLAPAVDDWLGRDATPAQIIRTLTANLPAVPIHHPARFLGHRLTTLLPPPLPPGPVPKAVLPLRTCDGCERAFRSQDPDDRCRDCRPADPIAA